VTYVVVVVLLLFVVCSGKSCCLIMGKLNVTILRYLTKEDFRVLTAVGRNRINIIYVNLHKSGIKDMLGYRSMVCVVGPELLSQTKRMIMA
jgi:hypothetical protein